MMHCINTEFSIDLKDLGKLLLKYLPSSPSPILRGEDSFRSIYNPSPVDEKVGNPENCECYG